VIEQPYTDDEIKNLWTGTARGRPGRSGAATARATAMLLVNIVVQKAPSIEKACTLLRATAKTMQDDARARWDHIKSETDRTGRRH
jgi:hypothetical protein